MKVLVVDDSPDVAEVVGLCFELRWPGTNILTATDGEDALVQMEQESPELVILDIGLPEMDGFQVCKEIRRTSSVPIIMLSVRNEDVDIARGLEAGADDYITKPFSHIEFLARTHAVMRRISGSGEDPVTGPFVSGDLSINLEAREIWLAGEYVRLTPIEFRILFSLVKKAGQVVPHQILLNNVWGPDNNATTNQLKVHIQHLRQKLGCDGSNPKNIVTEWRTGYKFVKLPPTDKARPMGASQEAGAVTR